MAVYNESDTVREIFQRVLEADVGLDKELIIVDDGSTDGTWKILTELGARTPPFRETRKREDCDART